MILIETLAALVGIYITIYVLYDLMLLYTRFFVSPSAALENDKTNRFVILIPAHNEELLIGRLLESINRLEYPADSFETVVVADNCTDGTSAVASSMGAMVLERKDTVRCGKGYAIKWGIKNINPDDFDALFIIDADSVVDPELLLYLNSDINSGMVIIQCYNGVANPSASWLTRLLNVSRTISNEILYPAKNRLGLSVNLMGNGMCFSMEVLKRFGWEAFSVGEDWEYYAMLVMSGLRIAFSNRARVYHQESATLGQATSQRMRWSSGRFHVIRRFGLGIFFDGLRRMDIKKIDAALPLLLPNPSMGVNISVVFLLISLVLPLESGGWFAAWFTILLAIQLLIFVIGAAYTKERLKNILSIFLAPAFLAWKMTIDISAAAGMGKKGWVRTGRKL